MKQKTFQVLRLIGVIIFVYVISRIDITQVINTISQANLTLLFLSLITVFAIYAVKILRWHTILKSTNQTFNHKYSTKIFLIGNFLSIITPGKLGELGRAAYITRQEVSRSTAIGCVLLDRIFDVIVTIVGFVIAINILFSINLFLSTSIALICGIIISSILFKFIKLKILKKTQLNSFILNILSPKIFMILILQSSIALLLGGIWFLLISQSIGVEAPNSALLSIFIIVGCISMLPIAPSGLGTRDITLIGLLALYGVNAETATAISIIMFCTIIIYGIPGMIFWLLSDNLSKIQNNENMDIK